MAKQKSPYFTLLEAQDKLTGLQGKLTTWSQKLYDSANEIVLDEEIGTLSASEKELIAKAFSEEDDSEWIKTKVDTKFYTKNAYRELLIKKIKQ